ncbi:MAG: hypothetical protein GX045_12070 [Clostridiaceae bacterium]|jgi:hypothetical protein|nr:hypothetical protein [Clostridiaceae bacterium]
MAYCVKCGVELERNLTSCPLCSTPVYLPEDSDESYQRSYPERVQKNQARHINLVPSKTFVYLMTFILVIPALVCFMVDIRGNGVVSWSFYPVASLLLFWVLMAYPALMKRYSFMKVLTIDIYSVVLFLVSLDLYSGGFLSWSVYPVSSLLLVWVYFLLFFIFGREKPGYIAIIGYISTALYLYLLEQATKSVWFFELALPILTLLLLEVIIVLILSGYKFFKGAGLSGLIIIKLSLFCFGCELIINNYVYGSSSLFWSLIVAVVLIPLSIFLFLVQSNEEFRVYLQKKFHL